MLFNSYLFIFAFLPVTLALFYLCGRFSAPAARTWIICASLIFYAWWRPLNVAIILPSILINFLLARRLQRLGADPTRARAGRITLIAGIVFNVAFLGFFKYTGFLQQASNDVLGTHFVLAHIILPLGISFITFQKIAFLIDVHARRIEPFSFADYALFVLFFPQLIAGPIVHYREVMPQFRRLSARFDAEDLTVGLTMFFIGLFKKAFLADSIAPLVTSIFDRAAHGDPVSVIPAVLGAVGFTLQIYFDFSGYSDMAIGIARLFGVRLPINFDSPLRASSIIDYWLRWHITLSRFLTAYIYNPLLLRLTRRRIAHGKQPLNARNATPGAFLALIGFPTLVTMFISGLWHGAGYTFIIWGLMHGVFLTVNHGWRFALAKLRKGRTAPPVWNVPGFLLTFVSVVLAMVFFKAPTLKAAWAMLGGIIGTHGVGLPAALFEHLGPMKALLENTGGGAETWWGAAAFLSLIGWIFLGLAIVLFLPNSGQLLAPYAPALGVQPVPPGEPVRLTSLSWTPSLRWGLALAVLAGAAILRFGGPSEFLYWQF
jgi:D-alanyl-lipoteichoic acid acyltransferase DltB (MBOAT superfamily)